MKKLDLKKLVVAALLASFTCVATMIIQIPNGIGGYFNLGDCVVLLCGWLLGPVYGALAAGVGSALADVFSSYLLYAPITMLIKSLMAILAFSLTAAFSKLKVFGIALSAVLAELFMTVSYFVFESVLYGVAGAIPGVIPNILQGICGIVCAILLKIFVDRKKLWKY